MGFLEMTGLDKVLPVGFGGKPKTMDLPAVTAQNFEPAPAPAPAPMPMGTLAGGRRRRSHKRRHSRKTKKHGRRHA
jgi:hypothetical protein